MIALLAPKGGRYRDKKTIDHHACFGDISEPRQPGFRSRETPAGVGGF